MKEEAKILVLSIAALLSSPGSLLHLCMKLASAISSCNTSTG